MNHSQALNNLVDLSAILSRHGAEHWLTDGTLLGYYREHGFIAHDLDTDLGVTFSSFRPAVISDFKSAGFSVERIFGYPEDCLELALVRNRVKTDLFFFYPRADNPNVVYHSAFAKLVNRIDYEYPAFSLKTAEFLGHQFWVPEDELTYITTKYGDSWHTPDTKWDWAYSPKNHKKTGIVIDLALQREKVDLWLKS